MTDQEPHVKIEKPHLAECASKIVEQLMYLDDEEVKLILDFVLRVLDTQLYVGNVLQVRNCVAYDIELDTEDVVGDNE